MKTARQKNRIGILCVAVILVLEAALVLPGWWKGYRTADAALLVGAQFTPLAAQAQLSDTTLVVQGAADPAAQSAPVALEAGKYLVTVSYTSDTGDATLAPEDAALGWDTGSVGLGKSSSGVENAWLTVPQGGAEVTFTVANGSGRLSIQNLSVSARPARMRSAALLAALLLALDAAAFGIGAALRRRPDRKSILAFALLAAVVVIACLPLLDGGLYHGSDLGYHMRRIENIAAGLSEGQFPVRIQPNWVNGYGYAVGVFYGDVFLYLPALLRIAGFSITDVMLAYLAGCSAATAASAYFCFRRMAGGARGPALLGAALYTLAPYRLCDLYQRAALGEYTALIFLPMIVCGVWEVYRTPKQPAVLAQTKRRAELPGWLLLALGVSGVLQSHLLTLEMTALFLAVFALLHFRRTFSRRVLPRLGKAVGLVLALNAAFLVPFLDYYFTGKFEINTVDGIEPIQANGALLGQLLGLRSASLPGLAENLPLTPGLALWLAALLCMVLLWKNRRARGADLSAAGTAALTGGGIAALLSWAEFPWDALYAIGGAARSLIGSLQFPWRFLSIASVLLALAACTAMALLQNRVLRLALSAGLCALCVCSALTCFAGYQSGVRVTAVSGFEETNWQLSCKHYLPCKEGKVDFNDLPQGPEWASGVTLRSYQRSGTHVSVDCTNASDTEAAVRLTLLYYKGYTARDDTTGEKIPVVCGKNNCAVLHLPAGYNGTILVSFREPWLWRAAELASLCCAALTIALLRKKRKYGQAKAEQEKKT
jgi:hypothetical protein